MGCQGQASTCASLNSSARTKSSHMRLLATILNLLLFAGFLFMVLVHDGIWRLQEYVGTALIVGSSLSSLAVLLFGTSLSWLDFRFRRN